MDIILIRGTKDAGKTTTAALTYSEILKAANKIHVFDAKNVEINSLRFNDDGQIIDFESILTVDGKLIVIISAGDDAALLMERIAAIIVFVENELKSKIDVLVCCGRSVNKSGSVYFRLKEIYPSSKLTEIWPEMTDNESDIKTVKAKSVDKIINIIYKK